MAAARLRPSPRPSTTQPWTPPPLCAHAHARTGATTTGAPPPGPPRLPCLPGRVAHAHVCPACPACLPCLAPAPRPQPSPLGAAAAPPTLPALLPPSRRRPPPGPRPPCHVPLFPARIGNPETGTPSPLVNIIGTEIFRFLVWEGYVEGPQPRPKSTMPGPISRPGDRLPLLVPSPLIKQAF